ncbi:MAG: glycosyltransferase, partial [Steroidobacteraceae bacterium]
MSSDRPGLAYVVHSLNPGGTERLVVEMSLAFAAEFDLHVLCLDEPGTWAERLRRRSIPVHCLWRQPGMDLSVAFSLASYFRRAGTRIVHAHQCTPWFYAALARLIYPVPRLLLEEHGRFYPEVDNPLRRLVNRLLIGNLTHDMVAVSRDVRQRLERYEGLASRRIAVQYNGVAEEPPLPTDERAALRRQLGLGPNDFVVGTAGRFDPIKNLPMLVEALARVSQFNPAIRGLLVGDGPVFPQIHAQVQRCALGERVVLTGFREDARQMIQ